MTDIFTANVLEWLFGALMGAPLGWLAGRKFARFINRRRAVHRRMNEPETHGDDGGHPTGKHIIAGLEDAVAYARGDQSRVGLSRKAGD